MSSTKPEALVEALAPVQSKRVASVDSIRGLASLAVLLSHTVSGFAWGIYTGWTHFPVVNAFFNGRNAVTMFFVLSGFVLSRPYISSGVSGQMPRKLFIPTFALRRFTRIWIPWFLVFCLSAVAQEWLFKPLVAFPPMSSWLERFWHNPFTLSNALSQSFFQQEDETLRLLPQDWSLAVEFKGSALIPVFLFLLRRHIGYLLGFTFFVLIYFHKGCFYFSFTLGLLLAHFYTRIEARVRPMSFAAKCGILLLGIALYQVNCAPDNLAIFGKYQGRIAWSVVSLGCVFILIASLNSRKIEAGLNHSTMLVLGRISYSVYLLQFVVLLSLLPPVINLMSPLSAAHPFFSCLTIVFLSVASTIGLSILSYRWIEAPCIELGHRLSPVLQRCLRNGAAWMSV